MYSRQKVHSSKSQGCLQSIYYLFLLQFPGSLISGDDWTILSGLWRLKFAAPPPTLLMARAPEPGRSLLSPRSPARVVTYANLFTRREQMFRAAPTIFHGASYIIIPSSESKLVSSTYYSESQQNMIIIQLPSL